MNSNKGITLAALVITIIVILILATTSAYIGYDAIQTSAEQKFLSMLKQVNEAVSLHMQDYENLNLTKLEPEENYDNISYKYKLETKEDYEKIGLADTHDIIYVNFDTGQIYSKKGINEKHTLKDFGVEYYKPTQEITSDENNEISFEIKLNAQQYSWKYIINYETIKCRGNPENGNLLYSEYSEDGKYKWKRVPKAENGYELETKQPGVYELKFRDDTGQESKIKQVYSYVKDGLKLYYDGEYNENYKHNGEATTWQDLSGNGNDAILNENHRFLENEKYLNCVKSTGAYSISKNNVFSTRPDNFTIETVAEFNSTQNSWICSIRDTYNAERMSNCTI